MTQTKLPFTIERDVMTSTLRVGDLTVNRLGFGAMRVCGPDIWGPPEDRDNAHAVLRRAIEMTAPKLGCEVGLAYGVSSLYILDAMKDFGAAEAAGGNWARAGPTAVCATAMSMPVSSRRRDHAPPTGRVALIDRLRTDGSQRHPGPPAGRRLAGLPA